MVISTKSIRAAALAAIVSIPTVPALASDVAIATDIATVYSRSGDIATVYSDSGDIGHLFEDTAEQSKSKTTKAKRSTVSQAGYGYNPCNPCPPMPACPPMPGAPSAPSSATPTPAPSPSDDTPPAPVAPAQPEASVAPAPAVDSYSANDNFVPMGTFTGGAGAAASAPLALAVAPGYIEQAKVRTRVRVRYDNFQGANAPTRGEFLYPTIEQLGGKGPQIGGIIGDDLDFQELSVYCEFAFRERFSAFIDAPVRWVEPLDVDGNGVDTQQGAGDIRAGFRWATVDNADSHRTWQIRVWAPTGEATRALGVGHASIDVGYLFDEKLSDNTFIFGEINDWQSIGAPTTTTGTTPSSVDLDANILRYGLGLGVELIDLGDCNEPCRFTGLVEVVGWTVLDGFVTPLDGTAILSDADGDTIINGKYGVRWNGKNQTVYVGYGHNWTGDRWYSDLFRLEWGYNF